MSRNQEMIDYITKLALRGAMIVVSAMASWFMISLSDRFNQMDEKVESIKTDTQTLS